MPIVRTSIASLLTFALLLVAGCGKTQKKPDPSPDALQDTGNGKPSAPTAEQHRACEEFLEATQFALTMHLVRKPEEWKSLVAAAYRNEILAIAKESKTEDKGEGLRQLVQKNQSGIDNCGPFQAAAARLTSSKGDSFIILLRESLGEFLQLLDRYSWYVSKKTLEETETETEYGAGIQLLQRTDYDLGRKPPYLVVEGFFPGSKNEEHEGLSVKNQITAIGGKAVSTLPYDQSFKALNNVDRKTKSVTITVRDSEGSSEREVTLEVGEYKVAFSRFKLLDPEQRIGTLNLSTFFSEKSAARLKDEWLAAIQDLIDRGSKPLQGLVLDLRGNGGGMDAQANELLEMLLPPHSIASHSISVYSSNRDKDFDQWCDGCTKFSVGSKPAFKRSKLTVANRARIRVPALVLLVDRKSASASEVVAGAVKDYRRGFIFGEPTYGKGIGQSVYVSWPTMEGAIAVTNTFLYSPAGNSAQLDGVAPHKAMTDPVLQWYQEKEKLNVRMKDQKAAGALIIDRPQPLEVDFKLPSRPEIPDDLAARVADLNFPEDPICKRLPGQEGFREEDDCLLAMATQYARELIRLQAGTTPVARK
jgi:C-terminal peptidase prc